MSTSRIARDSGSSRGQYPNDHERHRCDSRPLDRRVKVAHSGSIHPLCCPQKREPFVGPADIANAGSCSVDGPPLLEHGIEAQDRRESEAGKTTDHGPTDEGPVCDEVNNPENQEHPNSKNGSMG